MQIIARQKYIPVLLLGCAISCISLHLLSGRFTFEARADDKQVSEVDRHAFIQAIKQSKDLTTNLLMDNAGNVLSLELDYQDDLPVEHFEIIASINTLWAFTSRGNELTGAHFEALARSKSLSLLNLSGCKLDEQAISELVKIKTIRTLNFYNVDTDPEFIPHLAGMTSLEDLTIGHSEKIPYEVISGLCEKLPKLRKIDLSGSGLTPEEIVNLHRQFPALFIAWSDAQEVDEGG